jgi:TPR repeat protein
MQAVRLTSIVALVLAFSLAACRKNSPVQNTQPAVAEHAVDILQAKAELGDAEAQHELGERYVTGRGVSRDHVKGFEWHLKAANQGHIKAQDAIGFAYQFGIGTAQNSNEAVKWYKMAAEQGDALAQQSLGNIFYGGRGVPRDGAEAAKWYLKAAAQGDADSQKYLGDIYHYGIGVPVDPAEAVKWWLMAAQNGHAEAQYALGCMYNEYKNVPNSKANAFKWWLMAAQQEHLEAQHNIGIAYLDGEGVAKDEVQAFSWIRKSADQGRLEWQYLLGVMHFKGQGTAKNNVEAVRWFMRAAECGLSAAQHSIGALYYEGIGVPKDDVISYKWLLLAAAQGNETSKGYAKMLEGVLTPNQLAEGQRMAREFQPRKSPPIDRPIAREGVAESRPESTGSGFFITDDGYLITNQHVADENASVRVLTGSGAIPAKVVKVDRANDIALLKAEGKFSPLAITSSRGVRLGSTAATVGFPNVGLQGYSPKLAKGEIASLAGIQDDARHFQISVPVQPGNSGGALVDERGNVIGVVVAKLSQKAAIATTGTLAENVSYAVKSSYLLSFLESVPDVAAKLREPNTSERKFEDVIHDAEQAAVLVLVY